jgi:hypothetical protein
MLFLNRRMVWAVVIAALVSCQRLNIDRTTQVEAHDVKTLSFDAPNSEQSISIAVSAAEPINAYLVLEKDLKNVESQLNKQQAVSAGVLKQIENVKEGTLEGAIPAKQGFALLLTHRVNKTVEVKVKATGK